MNRSYEPCLCGATDCPRCFPGSYRNEARFEWVANYFPGKKCETCPLYREPIIPSVDTGCGVIDGDDPIDDCPALIEDEEKMADDAAYSKWESRNDS